MLPEDIEAYARYNEIRNELIEFKHKFEHAQIKHIPLDVIELSKISLAETLQDRYVEIQPENPDEEQRILGVTKKPKWKKTTDAEGLRETKEMKPIIVDEENQMIDIANARINELPKDWREDNVQAANDAIYVVSTLINNGAPIDSEMLENSSSFIHFKFLMRRKKLKKEIPAEQNKIYNGLSEEIKNLDREHVPLALQEIWKNSEKG